MSQPQSAAPPPLILASASPRRRELLAHLAVPFTVIPANIDESVLPNEVPRSYTLRLAYAKAQHVAQRHPAAVVLGADSTVVLEQQILGKPQDVAAAREMLRRLSGREHTVITGVAVLHQARQFVGLDAVSTRVCFHPLSASAIEAYIATGEPMDKAGAYAIQGAAAAFVAWWDGCYTNVVGLPLRRTAALLQAAGVLIAPAHSAQTAS